MLVHINDIVVITYEIHQMNLACYGLVHINDIVVSTYEIHHMLIGCYIQSLLLLILIVCPKHYCYSTYLSRLCFSDIYRFCWIWFFSFLQSYLQFELQSVSTFLLRLWVSQFAAPCSCLPAAVSRTWTWTHITCRYGYYTYL